MRRPTAVTLLAVLNILFGVLGLVCSPAITLGLLMRAARLGQDVGTLVPGGQVWLLASTGLGWVGAAVLLTSGVGMLRLRSWSRAAAVGWAVFSICLSTANLAAALLLRPPAAQTAAAPARPAPLRRGRFARGRFGRGRPVALALLGMIYPAVLLAFLTRPDLEAAFTPAAPSPDDQTLLQ